MTAESFGRLRVLAPAAALLFCFLTIAALMPRKQEAKQIANPATLGFTAEQRKMSPEDRSLTQAIRKVIHHEKNLSYNARNAVILAFAGKVILQGPVETATEKGILELDAGSVVGVENVTSEMKIIHAAAEPAVRHGAAN